MEFDTVLHRHPDCALHLGIYWDTCSMQDQSFSGSSTNGRDRLEMPTGSAKGQVDRSNRY